MPSKEHDQKDDPDIALIKARKMKELWKKEPWKSQRPYKKKTSRSVELELMNKLYLTFFMTEEKKR